VTSCREGITSLVVSPMRCRHFQRALAFVVACSAGAASSARADDAGPPRQPGISDILELSEETCLTKEKVAERLTPLLGSTKLPEGLRLTVRVDADGKTTFVVAVPGEDVGARSFETAGLTCENKLRVVSFALAVAIEGIMESRAARLRAPPAAQPSAPPPATRAPPPIAVPRTTVPTATWRIGLGEGLLATRLGPTSALMLSLERETSRYSVRGSLTQTLGATVTIDPGAVRYALTLGRLNACANVLRIGTVVGRACALAGAGSFEARGLGFFSRGAAGRSLWVDAGGSAEASISLSRRWTLRPSVAPFAILRGPTLEVTDARTGRVTASSDVPRIGVLFALEIAFRIGE
jgi:hypothetical protein